MFHTMQDCKTRVSKIKLPILIMHGGNDPITRPEGSHYLYKHIASKDKQIEVYDNLLHEIFNEPKAETIYSDIVIWLDKHC